MRSRIRLLCTSILAFALFCSFANASFGSDSFIKSATSVNSSLDNYITIVNGDSAGHFNLNLTNLNDVAKISPQEFDLAASETRKVNLSFFSDKEGIYLGFVNVFSGNSEKNIPVLLEIESKDVLFDSKVSVFPADKISPGDNVTAEIKIFDMYQIGPSELDINYFIKDFSGKIIFSGDDKQIVKDQNVVTKSFTLPKELKPGDYVFGAVLTYKNSVGTASTLFSVSKESFIFDIIGRYQLIAILIVVIVFVVFIAWILNYQGKQMKHIVENQEKEMKHMRARVSRGKIQTSESLEMQENLKKQLDALERAYSSKYITKEAYEKGKKRIQILLKKLKGNVYK